jgi:WD40 repeat protein
MILFKREYVITSRLNGLISFWNSKELKELYTFQGTQNGISVPSLCTDTSNGLLLTGDAQGYVTIYDTSRIDTKSNSIRRESIQLLIHVQIHSKAILSLCYIPPEHLWASGSSDTTSLMFDKRGCIIGSFGQETPWKLNEPTTYLKNPT